MKHEMGSWTCFPLRIEEISRVTLRVTGAEGALGSRWPYGTDLEGDLSFSLTALMLDKSLKGFACASVYLLRTIYTFHLVRFMRIRERIYVNPKENMFLV